MRNLLALFTLTVLLQAYCSPAAAANWGLVVTSESGNASLYVDRESIFNGPEKIIRAWTKFLFGNPESFESKSFSQMLVHIEVNCPENRTKFLELTFAYTDGSHEKFNIEREWRPVKPGTLENELYQYLCRQPS